MSQFLNPVPKLKAALVSEEARITLTEAASARQAVAQLLALDRPRRLFIDATAIGSVPRPMQLFDFAKWLARSLPRAARVALVVRPDQLSHARLIERLTRNAGTFLTYFIDPEKAQLWVRGPTFLPETLLPSWSSDTGPIHRNGNSTVTKETYVE